MNAWVKFANGTGRKVIYISVDGRFVPLPIISRSRYIPVACGSVTIDLYDGGLRLFKSVYLSVLPGKIQTVILY